MYHTQRRGVLERHSNYQLICMCDASKYFIGCVIYLKNIDSNSLNYISSHNKALDIQLVGRTMPVLELCAIEYATEKAQEVYDALTGRNIIIQIRHTFVFSDCTIALCWVAKSKKNYRGYNIIVCS